MAQAQNQFNQKGGLNGRLLQVAIANDDNEPRLAQQLAQELVKDSSVLAVIGNSSDANKAALGEYEKSQLAIISPTSGINSLKDDFLFTTVPSDAVTGKTLAEYVGKKLGLNKVVVFFNSNSVYSDTLTNEFTKNFAQFRGTVIRKINLVETRLDVEKEVTNTLLKDQAQAVVFFPDTQQTPAVLKIATTNFQQTKRQGLALLGGEALYNKTTLTEGGKAVEGLIVVVPWFRDAPQSKNFAQAAAQQWKGQVSWRTATSYDATQAFIKALDSANPSRSTVLQRLLEVKLSSSETSGDSLQFTEGERLSQPVLVKVENGRFTLVRDQR
ncbi:amino acid ABC transporter substrate-binding protein [Iningainema sp. BLCCT55]|uniref:Amino acid ABC transporter substrate-binding protein n=1 Tax=Iningainema tapete BLCC-T55 TaxID=2748662 RepID=A0A8J6XU74_9CYAN|nr:amino acid ABC transporter substrate-binding protein [Iningainema tapete BLCC-T55]